MALNAALDAAIDAVTRLRATLAKEKTPQVRSASDRMLIKATAQSWFQSLRPKLGALDKDPVFEQVNESFATLLELAEKHTIRSKYLSHLKNAKQSLVSLRSKGVLAAPQNPATKPDFARIISDPAMLAILDRRWNETLSCLGVNAPLAATVMMGGLLEALFLARINALPNQAGVFTAKSGPKDKQGITRGLKEWGLKDYLDVGHELGWIRQSAKDVGQVLRDYRNYIHPEKERSHGISLDAKDAEMFLLVFCSLATQIVETP